MHFTFTVEVDVNRVQGKFASRDEIASSLQEWLDNANESSITTDNDAEYEVESWDVSQADA